MGALAQLREGNRLRIVDELRRRGTATRAELAESTGLSRTTVTTLVAELQERGIAIEDGIADGARSLRGRPAMLLRLEPAGGAALGLDFGHSHIRVAVADLASTVLAERCVPFAVAASAPAALDAAAALARSVLDEAGISPARVVGAGMGLPGPLNQRTAIVSPSSILAGWGGRAAAQELATRLGVPVAVDNDANLGALAELCLGAGRGVEDLIYLKVASGIGAGLVLDGQLHHGATGIAGEIGHVQLRRDGAVCRCGNRGCLETVAASSAVLDLLRPLLGRELTLAGALELSRTGHVAVRRVVADAGRAVGRAVADLCNMLNPETIVVGGDLSQSGGALLAGVREAVDRYALPAAARAVRVVAAELGERAELLGALTLVIGDTENPFQTRYFANQLDSASPVGIALA